jgi:hypothetical protein
MRAILKHAIILGALSLSVVIWAGWFEARAQEQATEAQQTEASSLLTDEQLEVLVARIALYPDDLIAAIIAASLEPLQVVQAQRFLDKKKTDPNLKADPKWDGSVVSLLNYPDVVKMMNDDLDWVDQLGAAVASQEKDLLAAIQQLRTQATQTGVLKSDDKVVVEKEAENVVIKSADPEVVYVPSYDPQILTDPDYVVPTDTSPIYYSEPYPSYYYPWAGFWAGAVTGAFWGSAIDWNDGNCWGGDIDIDDINIGDIDIDNIRNNIDRDKIRNEFSGKFKDNFNRDNFKQRLEGNDRNRVSRKAQDRQRKSSLSNKRSPERRDVRKSVESGLKKQRQDGVRADQGARRTDQGGQRRDQVASRKQGQGAANKQRTQKRSSANRSAQRPGGRIDSRPRNVSSMGDYGRGVNTRQFSQRGHASRSGMSQYGGGGRQFSGGGSRRQFSGGGSRRRR